MPVFIVAIRICSSYIYRMSLKLIKIRYVYLISISLLRFVIVSSERVRPTFRLSCPNPVPQLC